MLLFNANLSYLRITACEDGLTTLFHEQQRHQSTKQHYSLAEFECLYNHEITKRHCDQFSMFSYIQTKLHWLVTFYEQGNDFKVTGQSRGPCFLLKEAKYLIPAEKSDDICSRVRAHFSSSEFLGELFHILHV